MLAIDLLYMGLKLVFFYSLVYSYVKFPNLEKHWLFLSALYTISVGALWWVYGMAPRNVPFDGVWLRWILITFAIMAVYLRLLARFDEGVLFWILLVAGIAIVWY